MQPSTGYYGVEPFGTFVQKISILERLDQN